MKKTLSILFATLILVSGMHLSIATHICGGKVAAVKWSFSGQKATCGMENTKKECPAHNGITSNCCHNKLSVYSVDYTYNPASFQIKEVTKSLLQIFYIPVNIAFDSYIASTSSSTIISPPDNLLASAVSLSKICIFRI
jgi:hypothetical protein